MVVFYWIFVIYSRLYLWFKFTFGLLWNGFIWSKWRRRWNHSAAGLSWSSWGWDQTFKGTFTHSRIGKSSSEYKVIATTVGSWKSAGGNWNANLPRLLLIKSGCWTGCRGTGTQSWKYYITGEPISTGKSFHHLVILRLIDNHLFQFLILGLLWSATDIIAVNFIDIQL